MKSNRNSIKEDNATENLFDVSKLSISSMRKYQMYIEEIKKYLKNIIINLYIYIVFSNLIVKKMN